MSRQQKVKHRPTGLEWIASRDRLMAMNLPIDKSGCMLAGEVFDLMNNNPQFVKDMEIYLTPSPYEEALSTAFSRVSNLIDTILDHPDVWQRLVESTCHFSDDAIYCLRNKNMGRLLYLERILIEYLRDLAEEE